MDTTSPLYRQIFQLLRQYSHKTDLRHLKALAWMCTALILSESLTLSKWEPYVQSEAKQAQSYERRWQRFLENPAILVEKIYLPLVLLALSHWHGSRLYLALDTTVLWDRYCMIHLSVCCCGRAVPLLWKVLEHDSATVAFSQYEVLLRKARWLLRHHQDVMLLADRAFACHDLIDWLKESPWHYALRLKSDVLIQADVHPYPVAVGKLAPPVNEAKCYQNVRLWADGLHCSNLVLATVKGAKDSWAVITDEKATIQTLWHYGLRFQLEEMFLDSKSGVFQLEDSRVRSPEQLSRLYLIVALSLLFGTLNGMAVHCSGLRRQVDPHWKRGLSYLKIGLRYLQGVVHKGRSFLPLTPLFSKDPEPCFASRKAERDQGDKILFSRIRMVKCKLAPT
jgi:Transposase DDE domain